jgi:hypothetical protein
LSNGVHLQIVSSFAQQQHIDQPTGALEKAIPIAALCTQLIKLKKGVSSRMKVTADLGARVALFVRVSVFCDFLLLTPLQRITVVDKGSDTKYWSYVDASLAEIRKVGMGDVTNMSRSVLHQSLTSLL